MGAELGSKVWMVGEVMPVGRLRMAAETTVATWFASLFLSELASKVTTTRLTPIALLELMSVMPAIVETTFSMTCVTCWSTTLGVAPV